MSCMRSFVEGLLYPVGTIIIEYMWSFACRLMNLLHPVGWA